MVSATLGLERLQPKRPATDLWLTAFLLVSSLLLCRPSLSLAVAFLSQSPRPAVAQRPWPVHTPGVSVHVGPRSPGSSTIGLSENVGCSLALCCSHWLFLSIYSERAASVLSVCEWTAGCGFVVLVDLPPRTKQGESARCAHAKHAKHRTCS